jgi:hypothetical protein
MLDSDTFNSSVHETFDKSQKNIFLPAEPLFLPETPQKKNQWHDNP